eukprot:TRINITY_DN1401_c0_g1_i1.p1 TRINITY_DN1401_c0_g1~~TRINITY_DN1401_c0_g1_i1.p1  ORF type:complete len:281 (-),score=49.90 TRINITY_DN1401_c0_g1_i1:48-890(-)
MNLSSSGKDVIEEKIESELFAYPRLNGKIVVITGASAGIGEACAELFACSGAQLILGARRVERLEALRDALTEKYKVGIHIGALDVTNSASVEAFFKAVPAELHAVDILINNAGLALGRNEVHSTPEQDVDTMIDTNVKGVMRVTKAVLPGMIERNNGHVINISSVAGLEAYKGGSVYCASKAAVQSISVALRKELAATNIRVSIVNPGLVETEFSVVRFSGDKDKAATAYQGMTPLTAADIADNVVYIASRPPHVQIADVLVFPTAQASAEIVHRAASS